MLAPRVDTVLLTLVVLGVVASALLTVWRIVSTMLASVTTALAM
jgi:hypothetical protein